MRPEDVLECLLGVPFVIVTSTAVPSTFMDVLHVFEVLFVLNGGLRGMRDEEGIMCVTGRVCLWLEE